MNIIWCHNIEEARRDIWRKSSFFGRAHMTRKQLEAKKREKVKKQNAYRAIKLSATPSWADRLAIDQIYKTATERGKRTGKKYNVDHIVPLQGKSVCGLHVQTNLRIVLARTNHKKGNRFDKNMEEHVLRMMARDQSARRIG